MEPVVVLRDLITAIPPTLMPTLISWKDAGFVSATKFPPIFRFPVTSASDVTSRLLMVACPDTSILLKLMSVSTLILPAVNCQSIIPVFDLIEPTVAVPSTFAVDSAVKL